MDFDRVIDRKNTESAKWNWYDEDVLPMWVADMDFRSPEPVIEALNERVNHGIFGYGFPPEGLRAAIVSHLLEMHNWDVIEDQLDFISGVVTGFTHAIYTLTEPGDGILIQTPVYPPILKAPEAAGRRCVQNELQRQADGRYEIDFEDFSAKARDGVKLFILCNPHNPVGRVFSKAELTRMAEICLENNVLICSDEIHSDLVFSGFRHIPIASISPEIAEKTVTYFAPSKTFNLAGLGTSVYVASNPVIRKQLSKTMTMLLGHPNILGLYAAKAAYQHGRDWLEAVMVYLEKNRDFLLAYCKRELPEMRVSTPEGTFLAWLDCRELGLDCSPQRFFLEKARVGLNDGCDFGVQGEGFARLNFGCPQELLEEGLSRMKTALG